MVEGVWRDIPRDLKSTGGAFVRARKRVPRRGWLASPSPDATGSTSRRACPWAHRTLVVRALKGPGESDPGVLRRPVHGGERLGVRRTGGIRYLHQLYAKAKPDYTGRVTVPVLWDEQDAPHRQQRVLRDHPHAQPRVRRARDGASSPTSIPKSSEAEIDRLNERIYRTVNNGVYRAGFATAQDKYEQAVTALFAHARLAGEAAGEAPLAVRRAPSPRPTCALFTTLVRFDAVYYSHFKCNLRRLVDYPRLWRYTRRIYALPGVARTVDLAEIKAHYYRSMKQHQPDADRAQGAAARLSLALALALRRCGREREQRSATSTCSRRAAARSATPLRFGELAVPRRDQRPRQPARSTFTKASTSTCTASRVGLKFERDGWRFELSCASASRAIRRTACRRARPAWRCASRASTPASRAPAHRLGHAVRRAARATSATAPTAASCGSATGTKWGAAGFRCGRTSRSPGATRKLNNYYYGVRPARPPRSARRYEPGAGVNLELGLNAAYRLSENWQLFGG